VTEYASYYYAGGPSHLPCTGWLLSPQSSGLRDATTVTAAVAFDKGKPGEPSFSATFQEGFKNGKRRRISVAFSNVFKTQEREVGEPAHTTAKEVYASSVANAAERQPGRFGPTSCDRQALCRSGHYR
jgi:hypothetical protein